MTSPLIEKHFPDSKVSWVHQTGASAPLATGLTVKIYGKKSDPLVPDCAELLFGDGGCEYVGLIVSDDVLQDYDGVFECPAEVAELLKALGIDTSYLEEDSQ